MNISMITQVNTEVLTTGLCMIHVTSDITIKQIQDDVDLSIY